VANLASAWRCARVSRISAPVLWRDLFLRHGVDSRSVIVSSGVAWGYSCLQRRWLRKRPYECRKSKKLNSEKRLSRMSGSECALGKDVVPTPWRSDQPDKTRHGAVLPAPFFSFGLTGRPSEDAGRLTQRRFWVAPSLPNARPGPVRPGPTWAIRPRQM